MTAPVRLEHVDLAASGADAATVREILTIAGTHAADEIRVTVFPTHSSLPGLGEHTVVRFHSTCRADVRRIGAALEAGGWGPAFYESTYTYTVEVWL